MSTTIIGAFAINAIFPVTGAAVGGNVLTLTASNAPDISDYSYISDGLVAHYDGIDNAGPGVHDAAATVWTDLSGNGYDVTLSGASGWTDKGFKFPSGAYFYRAVSSMPMLPVANQNYTIEAVWNPAQTTNLRDGGFVGWGCNGAYRQTNNTRFLNASTTQQCFRHYWWTDDFDFCMPSSTSEVRNLSISYDNTVGRKGYSDAALFGTHSSTAKNTCATGNFLIGKTTNNEYGSGNLINSIRIYNRTLDADEIQHNFQVDNVRFRMPVVVKVGDGLCTNPVIISAAEIRCTIPPGTGNQAVTVSYGGSGDVAVGTYDYSGAGMWLNGKMINIPFVDGRRAGGVWLGGKRVY
ncbi:MAG: LamG domain-containing protein [Rickettsiales bacterium]|jgi:hypothetical protein|nr:LamG domain-containing protein [Rickettsiales bacterium]